MGTTSGYDQWHPARKSRWAHGMALSLENKAFLASLIHRGSSAAQVAYVASMLRRFTLHLLARPWATLPHALRQSVSVADAAIRLHHRLEFVAYRQNRLADATGRHRHVSWASPARCPRSLGQQELAGQQRAVRLAMHRAHRAAHQMNLGERPLVRPEQALVFPPQAVERGGLRLGHLTGVHVGEQPDRPARLPYVGSGLESIAVASGGGPA